MNQEIPYISIIVPVYNTELYIGKCVDSVLCQSYKNWELLLVDDGSTDNSGKICDSYSGKDDRIKVIHKPNEGVSSARNLGVEAANGDFVTFIDSDDWIESEYLLDFVRMRPKEHSIIVSGMKSQDPKREYVSFEYSDESTENGVSAANLIVRYGLFRDGGPFNKLFDLKLIKESGLRFRVDLSYHEDHIFVYSYYMLIDTIILSGYCGYHYMHYGRSSKNSLSAIGKNGVENLFKASDTFLNIIPNLFTHYDIQEQEYKRKVLTCTGYSQRILALYNVYFNSDTPSCHCRELLKREHKRIRNVRNSYYCPSVKRNIFMILLSAPVNISHTLLICLRYLNTLLKVLKGMFPL